MNTNNEYYDRYGRRLSPRERERLIRLAEQQQKEEEEEALAIWAGIKALEQVNMREAARRKRTQQADRQAVSRGRKPSSVIPEPPPTAPKPKSARRHVGPFDPPGSGGMAIYNQDFIFPDGRVMKRQFHVDDTLTPDETARVIDAMVQDDQEFLSMYLNSKTHGTPIRDGAKIYQALLAKQASQALLPLPMGAIERVA